MSAPTLVLGGCRSGKSRFALQTAEALPAAERVYVATCQVLDQEMEARVARHRRERQGRWRTVEAPFDLRQGLRDADGPDRVCLVDCLTMWVSNLLLSGLARAAIEKRFAGLVGSLPGLQADLFLVSNEVGAGVVPESSLGRQFRDLAGELNQLLAEASGSVYWMVAGIPVPLKVSGQRRAAPGEPGEGGPG